MIPASILLIDDDAATIAEVLPALRQDGYEVACTQPGMDAIRMGLGRSARSGHSRHQFAERGLGVLPAAHDFPEPPAASLIVYKNQMDRVKGFELGADDCMIKPVVIVELAARARSLLRWSASQAYRRPHSLFVDGDLIVDLAHREVQVNSQPVALTPTEFRILACFTKHAEEALSHEEILAEVWGPNHEGRRDILKLYVHNLRKKLEPDPGRPKRILTRRGEGYVLKRLTANR